MISISTLTANTNGAVIIEEDPESSLKQATARVSQVSTLDGNSNVAHKGFSHGDRQFSIIAVIDEATENKLWTIFTTESLVYITTKEGFFKGAISRLDIKGGDMSMDIAIKEKLA